MTPPNNPDASTWLTEALATRDLDRLKPNMAAGGERHAACRRVEKELRLGVNPIVRSPAEWQRRGPNFLADIHKGPLVAVVGPR